MATWPANGVTDWNTKMKANIDVGHDSDGTHKKSQMLTDMGWSPTAYAGEESVTYPNGLIVKSGYIAKSATITTLTFGTPFPTALVSIVVSAKRDANATDYDPVVWSESVSSVQFRTSSPVAGYYWEARGY